MSRSRTNSSLSSFENQQNDDTCLPTFQPRHRKENNHKINSLKADIKQRRYQAGEFSEFEDENQDSRYQQSMRRMEQSSAQVIAKLKQQIVLLKTDNHKLQLNNMALMQELQRARHSRSKLQTKLIQQENQQTKINKKHKIETLLQEMGRIKQNTNKLRVQSDKDAAQITMMRKKIEQYEKVEVQWGWKNKFIDLFIDMLRKISDGIEEDWSEKKKIQIGWKIVKNVVDKAINSGIKVPKIQKNRQ